MIGLKDRFGKFVKILSSFQVEIETLEQQGYSWLKIKATTIFHRPLKLLVSLEVTQPAQAEAAPEARNSGAHVAEPAAAPNSRKIK